MHVVLLPLAINSPIFSVCYNTLCVGLEYAAAGINTAVITRDGWQQPNKALGSNHNIRVEYVDL